MKNIDVRRIVQAAEKRGIRLDDYEAKVFLGASEMLKADPNNEHARKVVESFQSYLETGEFAPSFAEFSLPIPYTDEEREEIERQRIEYVSRHVPSTEEERGQQDDAKA